MLQKLFSRSARTAKSTQKPKPTIVVSGLPRSGTSMMMKILADGGVPILKDEIRYADEDNPNGYYEFEPVKQLAEGQHQWLADGSGKAVKIISALLEYLPSNYSFKVIFMEREIKEILASQQKMLTRRSEKSAIDDAEMQQQFEQHLAATKYWLGRQPNIDVLYVEYNKMMRDADSSCQQIADFIGVAVDIEKMRAVPNGQLYRNRT